MATGFEDEQLQVQGVAAGIGEPQAAVVVAVQVEALRGGVDVDAVQVGEAGGNVEHTAADGHVLQRHPQRVGLRQAAVDGGLDVVRGVGDDVDVVQTVDIHRVDALAKVLPQHQGLLLFLRLGGDGHGEEHREEAEGCHEGFLIMFHIFQYYLLAVRTSSQGLTASWAFSITGATVTVGSGSEMGMILFSTSGVSSGCVWAMGETSSAKRGSSLIEGMEGIVAIELTGGMDRIEAESIPSIASISSVASIVSIKSILSVALLPLSLAIIGPPSIGLRFITSRVVPTTASNTTAAATRHQVKADSSL